MARGYLEGVAAAYYQKERALKVIQKYTRLKDPKLTEELYADGVKFLDRAPRVEADAIAPIAEFMGKKPIAVETIADNSSSTGWSAKVLSIDFTPSVSNWRLGIGY